VNGFLNRIFNNLNWAITEFGVSAKEFQTALSRHYTEIQQFQRKCNVMFDFSFTLLRMLEFVAYELPGVFLDQDMNLTRLSESLIFVLNRTTTGPDSKLFESILKLEMIAMDRITRVAILGPLAGILVNLSAYHGKQSLAKMLVSTGGLHMETFQFLCTFDWQKAVSGTEENPLLQEKIDKLKQFIKGLDQELIVVQEEAQQAAKLPHSQSEEFCPICYAAPIDTRFEPCNHRSCNKCIQRHLLNSQKCFFCNAIIEKAVLETTPQE